MARRRRRSQWRVIPNRELTYWARRVGPGGSIADIEKLLSQAQETSKGMFWREGEFARTEMG